jgi:hypothetical protein
MRTCKNVLRRAVNGVQEPQRRFFFQHGGQVGLGAEVADEATRPKLCRVRANHMMVITVKL